MIFRQILYRFIIVIGFTISFLECPAQFDTSFVKTNMIKCADSMVYGFKKKDWNIFTRYTNPALIGNFGGVEGFKKYISQVFMQIPDSAWKKYVPGKILQVIKTGTDLQSVIELISIIEWQGVRISTTSYLIGQSWDGGLFWTFFDSQGDARSSRMIKPDLSPELIIPIKKEKTESLAKSQPKPVTTPVKSNTTRPAKANH